jgi:hypothetical protein
MLIYVGKCTVKHALSFQKTIICYLRQTIPSRSVNIQYAATSPTNSVHRFTAKTIRKCICVCCKYKTRFHQRKQVLIQKAKGENQAKMRMEVNKAFNDMNTNAEISHGITRHMCKTSRCITQFYIFRSVQGLKKVVGSLLFI